MNSTFNKETSLVGLGANDNEDNDLISSTAITIGPALTVTSAVFIQPFASVTVTVYELGAKSIKVFPVSPVLHS